MEPNYTDSTSQQTDLTVGIYESNYLNEAATWAKFLGIVGFIGCGFLVLFSFFAGSIMSNLGELQGESLPSGMGAMLTVIYILIAALYFWPCYYLFSFATKMKHALMIHDQQSLQRSFQNLKSCFKFFGILTIIALSLYGVILIAVVAGASMFAS